MRFLGFIYPSKQAHDANGPVLISPVRVMVVVGLSHCATNHHRATATPLVELLPRLPPPLNTSSPTTTESPYYTANPIQHVIPRRNTGPITNYQRLQAQEKATPATA